MALLGMAFAGEWLKTNDIQIPYLGAVRADAWATC
jgi:hypothetical protein